jgi:hypothetical protein
MKGIKEQANHLYNKMYNWQSDSIKNDMPVLAKQFAKEQCYIGIDLILDELKSDNIIVYDYWKAVKHQIILL